ncbi:MarR family winged helix-turn-helix transcriptional regulator [Pseudonocardia acidicola]|uniref:MarR family transcriptional regulator n=1 Tax=Pseudonocardia acidicola TaxID=2724939 RepID=A0ABX1SE14_9PSEU|nr:MarR family transcriptional regulator [Pseudonocardia acidicola]NMH98509.1 MarR family transcriptional regulator [Pseudonocardia acidicola]
MTAEDPLIDDERITAFGRLVEVHARLERLLGRELEADADLPLSWFEALLRLARSPDGELSSGELSRQIALTSGGVTRLVDRLSTAGLVERRPSPADRRSQLVTITEQGRAALGRACAVHVRGLDEHVFSRLTDRDVRDLERVLDRLRPDR